MEEWKEYRLGDLIEEIAMGPFGSNIKVDCYVDFGIPVLNGSNLQGFKLNENSFNYVTEEKADSLGRANAFRGDIVITHRGTLGQIIFIPEDSKYDRYVISQSQFRVKFKKDIDSKFIVYFFHSKKGQQLLLSNASQVGVPAIARPSTSFKELKAVLPPLPEQKKIVAILSSLDEKIETNRKINAKLEELAQAIFKSWFIDFKPFGGKMPEDWEYKYVSDFPHEIETGRRPKGGVSGFTGGIPSIGAESIKGIGYYDYSKTKYIPIEYAETLKTGRVQDFDLLIYKDGGKPGYFIPNFSMMGLGFPFKKMFLNEHVFRLNFNSLELNIFAYFFFKTDNVMNYLNSVGGKAAIPGINQKNIEDIVVLDLNLPQIKKFGEIVLPMFKQILENCKKNARLAELRDVLIPKLMGGEIKV